MGKLTIVALTMFVATPGPAAAAPPSASFTYSPGAPFTNETITFVSTSTGQISSQSWDLNGDRACGDVIGPSAQRAFPTSGAYAVTLCVSGGTGSSTSTDTVTVRNRPPIAAFTHAPSAPQTGESIVLTSFSADPDGPIVLQAWDLDGDGAFDDRQGSTAAIEFPKPGTYTVKLLVTDRDGAPSVAVRSIAVHEPVAAFITPFPVVRMVGTVRARGTTVREIVVRVPQGARVRIRCRGPGCPRGAKQTSDALTSRTMHVRRFAHRTLRPGAVVQISVTKRGVIGKYTRFRIRAGKPPSRIDRCLPPGAKRPMRCGA